MNSRSMSLPVRATLFYTIALLALITIGSDLQSRFRLSGLVFTEVGLFLGLTAVFALLVDRRSAGEVFRIRPLTGKGLLKSLLLGLVAWALAQVLGMLMLTILEMLGGQMPAQYQELLSSPYPVALLVGALLPAICEEAAFRGYILSSLQPLGETAAVLLTGLLFGMMHLSLIRLLPLTVLGWLFAAAVQRTGSLLPSMCMHFVNNAIALTLSFLLPNQSDSLLTGEESQFLWPGLLAMALLAVVLATAAWSVLRTLGPGDVAGSDPARVDSAPDLPSPAPDSNGTLARNRWLLTLVPLLPALLIYLWAASSELAAAFTPSI